MVTASPARRYGGWRGFGELFVPVAVGRYYHRLVDLGILVRADVYDQPLMLQPEVGTVDRPVVEPSLGGHELDRLAAEFVMQVLADQHSRGFAHRFQITKYEILVSIDVPAGSLDGLPETFSRRPDLLHSFTVQLVPRSHYRLH